MKDYKFVIGNTATYLKLGVIKVGLKAEGVDALRQRLLLQYFIAVRSSVNVSQLSEYFLHQNLLARFATVL